MKFLYRSFLGVNVAGFLKKIVTTSEVPPSGNNEVGCYNGGQQTYHFLPKFSHKHRSVSTAKALFLADNHRPAGYRVVIHHFERF